MLGSLHYLWVIINPINELKIAAFFWIGSVTRKCIYVAAIFWIDFVTRKSIFVAAIF